MASAGLSASLGHVQKCEKVQFRGHDFFWIKYRQACRELPILFPNRPILRTQLNKMVRLVASLKKHGLIDTARSGSRCYIHITQKAGGIVR
jgi:hypothetical protein